MTAALGACNTTSNDANKADIPRPQRLRILLENLISDNKIVIIKNTSDQPLAEPETHEPKQDDRCQYVATKKYITKRVVLAVKVWKTHSRISTIIGKE